MKKFFLAMALLCLLSFASFAQSPLQPIPQKIQQLKLANSQFNEVTVFKKDVLNIKGNSELEREINNGNILSLDLVAIHNLLELNPANLRLSIPNGQSELIELELFQSDIFSAGFKISGSKSGTIGHTSNGLHYHGIVKGDDKSVVAISIFKNEIHGIIADDSGNRVIGKLSGTNKNHQHILYHEDDLVLPFGDLCAGTLPTRLPESAITNQLNSTVGDCVKIYFEADHDIYLNKGSNTTNVSNYVTGFFNEVAVLFANEMLEIDISEIFIHESPSNYSGPGAGDYLDQFADNTPNFNGDLGHYINLKNLGGVAYLNVLCANSNFRRGYSGVGSSYQTVPTYSWTVNVIAHELGHNFGSNHTQACVWNNNNTAIDGCVDSEGSCPNGPNPTNGGTIMSYCHVTGFGINFNLGFGDQPGDVMRSRVASANCLDPNCNNIPTCDDNIQNGNETGVDCGGTCPACPTCDDGILNNEETAIDCGGPNCAACPCLDFEMTLTIVFDNYPEETAWSIVNATGTTVAAESYTNAQPDGSTLAVPICLPAGCYDFIITDSYGDGICCFEGDGSYTLTDVNGTVNISGGEFTTTETTNFCLTPPSNCTPFLVIDGFDSGIQKYQAEDYISSNATILPLQGVASDVTYEAGDYIDLTEGFYVLAGNTFFANTVPCTNLPTGDPNTLLLDIDFNENGLATFNFSIPNDDVISVSIFDIDGNEVAKIIDHQSVKAGAHLMHLDKRKLQSGLLMLKIASSTATKMVKWIN